MYHRNTDNFLTGTLEVLALLPHGTILVREQFTVKILIQPHGYLKHTRATIRGTDRLYEDLTFEIATMSHT
jgi:hypothetical protein